MASCLLACNKQANNDLPSKQIEKTAKSEKSINISKNEVLSTDLDFFSDSLLHGHRDALKYYFKKYCGDLPCSPIGVHYDKKETKERFEGVKFIGDINHNEIKDSVFVLEPLVLCQFEDEKSFDGQAYYFTDIALPRLQTDSYCCHPENIFTVGDIDEDGISEIGQYYSSCSSRYKSLYVYSLKNKKWKEIGHCVYDLMHADEKKPYKDFIKKTEKNKFQMLEITDLSDDKTKIGKPNWLLFSM